MIFYPRAESEKRPFPGNTRKHDASPSEKKTGNLIHRAEAWPLLKFIRLEYSTMNNLQYLVPFGPQGRCFRSNHRRCSVKKGVLRNFLENSQESTCARASFLIKLAQVFSCEFCEISKNTFFIEHVWGTASYYRPVSILSIFLKVFERSMFAQGHKN